MRVFHMFMILLVSEPNMSVCIQNVEKSHGGCVLENGRDEIRRCVRAKTWPKSETSRDGHAWDM